MKTNSTSRLLYIDNLRIFLISLVVLLHFNITYGAPGSWYYNESQAGFPEIIPMSMFNATNQAFFMGMFFFISSFFIIPSLNRKGTGKFVKDRLVRLGIPLLFFYFILCPLTVFIHNHYISGEEPSYIDYIINGWGRGFGPLWFVEALLVFTAVYLLIKPLKFRVIMKFPTTAVILGSAILIALGQFVIRIWLPVGWSFSFTGFQFPHFLQYIFLFAFGIVAYENHWLESISYKMGKQWFLFAQGLIFIGFPLLFLLGGASENGIEKFMGGVTFQSFSYTIWEQLVGFSLIIGLFGISKKYFNTQGKFAKQLSDSVYGFFVFPAPVIVGLAAIFRSWNIFPPLKFIILAPVALFLSFLVAGLIKRIPGVKNIL